MKKVLSLSGVLLILNVSGAFAAPLVEGPQNFHVSEVSNSGLVAGNRSGRGGVWNPANNIVDILPVPADAAFSTAVDINTAGQICGNISFSTAVYPQQKSRAMIWTGPGSNPQDLGASNSPDVGGRSSCKAINNLGVPVGDSSHCRAGESWFYPHSQCGPHPMSGTPFAILGAEPTASNRFGIAVDNNDAGQAVGTFWNPANDTMGYRLLENGSALTDIGFEPKRITNNGTIYGHTGSAVKMRSPLGTESTIPCGAYFLDANEYGDVLTYSFGPDAIRVWHDNKCEFLSAVLPEGSPSYTFPSQTNTGAFLNDNRQIAANVKKPGVPVANTDDYFVILFTPKYVSDPLPAATPTALSGTTPLATPGGNPVPTAVVPLDPTTELTSKLNSISALLKKIKAKFPKAKKAEQSTIKSSLKNEATELFNFVNGNKASIQTSSAKVDLSKLAKALKTAVGKVTKRKDSFNDDKKSANKSLKNLQKGIAL